MSIRLYSKPHLALGGVKNVSLNLTISNAGDDAYDTNIYFNFSREVFYINFWQKVRPRPPKYPPFKDTCLLVIYLVVVAGKKAAEHSCASSTLPVRCKLCE